MAPRMMPRAPRYPVTVPLQFRGKGELDWNPGQIVNVSRTGLLFSAARALPHDAEFEARFSVLAETTDAGPEVRCTAVVVRHCTGGDQPLIIAGRILRSEYPGDTEDA